MVVTMKRNGATYYYKQRDADDDGDGNFDCNDGDCGDDKTNNNVICG